jgi:hypothetical protein
MHTVGHNRLKMHSCSSGPRHKGVDKLGKGRSYGELKQASKVRRRKLAENIPDTKAAEWFKAPAYQAGRMMLSQANIHDVRWIDLMNYMLQHVMDGSMRLSDPIPTDLDQQLRSAGHLDVVDYLADKYDIKRGAGVNE